MPAAFQGRSGNAAGWKANIAKSQRHANHQFESATLTFEVAGDEVTARIDKS